MQVKVVRDILHEELLLKLKKLASSAEVQFSKLVVFKGSTWQEDVWRYKGREKLNLFARGSCSQELTLLNKVFIVNYLWERRASSKQVSFSRVRDLISPIKNFVSQGSTSLVDLDQDYYFRTFGFLQSRYKYPAGPCRAINYFVRFLFDSGLAPQNFDLIGAHDLEERDKYGRLEAGDKLPLPELIKAIIALKWAIKTQWDGSLRAQIDYLAVLTQVFQFGLGLRIGEILRLPKNCLVEIGGEMYCRVWTEKGSEPIARYVPTIWRSAFSDAVDSINNICQPYRARALSIENGSFADELKERFHARANKIESEVQNALERLHCKVRSNVADTKSRLHLLKSVSDDEMIELKNLAEYLPVASSSTSAASLLKFYRANGFNLISKPLGKKKCAHYVQGRDLKKRIKELVELRRGFLLYDEVFEILHGRQPAKNGSKDRFAFKDKLKLWIMSSFEYFAFTGEPSLHGRRTVYLSRADALLAVRTVVGGGYDKAKYIPVLDAEQLFPEFFNQKTLTSVALDSERSFYSFLKLSSARKNFYRPSPLPSELRYRAAYGFLIDQSSIIDAVESSFVSINSRVSAALVEDIKEEFLADGMQISSASFGINQQVSDYLFLVPASLGGVYNEYLPSIFDYHAVLHVIKPTNIARSAFFRYGIAADEKLIKSFQSHKGRHWQTNSLFRAGLAASIVNKWMGRTDSQGDHYDHQTPRERAAKVSELMLSEQSRFIGELANKVKSWSGTNVSDEHIQGYLNNTLQTVHYGPLGHCFRDINLKPCEFHLKCLTGNAGKGCREFVVDMSDPIQVKQIEAERSRAENELSRLFEAINRPDVPVESVEMHIEHQMTVFRNASYILDRSDIVLTQEQVEQSQDYQPFVHEGSIPSDCVFQCGAT